MVSDVDTRQKASALHTVPLWSPHPTILEGSAHCPPPMAYDPIRYSTLLSLAFHTLFRQFVPRKLIHRRNLRWLHCPWRGAGGGAAAPNVAEVVWLDWPSGLGKGGFLDTFPEE